MSARSRSVLLPVALAVACVPPGGAQAAKAPSVQQLVVFRGGKVVERSVSTAAVRVRVRGRRCAVPARTPLASLVRMRPGRLKLKDFGSCSSNASDAAGLFVSAIDRDGERGTAGWVYKVGRKAGTAGAADPSGPFGRGRLRSGNRVVWFYCLKATRCQRTLEVRTAAQPGVVQATVTSYNDAGRARREAGATVHAGGTNAVTGADGRARIAVPAGRRRVYAEKPGLVRSFTQSVVVP